LCPVAKGRIRSMKEHIGKQSSVGREEVAAKSTITDGPEKRNGVGSNWLSMFVRKNILVMSPNKTHNTKLARKDHEIILWSHSKPAQSQKERKKKLGEDSE